MRSTLLASCPSGSELHSMCFPRSQSSCILWGQTSDRHSRKHQAQRPGGQIQGQGSRARRLLPPEQIPQGRCRPGQLGLPHALEQANQTRLSLHLQLTRPPSPAAAIPALCLTGTSLSPGPSSPCPLTPFAAAAPPRPHLLPPLSRFCRRPLAASGFSGQGSGRLARARWEDS